MRFPQFSSFDDVGERKLETGKSLLPTFSCCRKTSPLNDIPFWLPAEDCENFLDIFPFLSIHQSSPLFCVARLQCSSWRKFSHKIYEKLIEDYDERNTKRWAQSIHSICVSPSRVWNFWNEINVFPQVFPAYSPLSRRLFAVNVDISSRVFICSKA